MLSRIKSRDYKIRLTSRKRRDEEYTSVFSQSPLSLLFPLSLCIPPPFVAPYRPFILDPLSPQILAQHASPFLFTASKLLLFAYLLSYSRAWSRILYVLYVVGHVLSLPISLLTAIAFFSKEKKE